MTGDTVSIPADLIPIGTIPIGATMYSRRRARCENRFTQENRKGLS
ncbi:MAG TPA: hypothetical protein VII33_01820 [Nakamurella sp.]